MLHFKVGGGKEEKVFYLCFLIGKTSMRSQTQLIPHGAGCQDIRVCSRTSHKRKGRRNRHRRAQLSPETFRHCHISSHRFFPNLWVRGQEGHSWTPFQSSFSRLFVSEGKPKCMFLRGGCNETPKLLFLHSTGVRSCCHRRRHQVMNVIPFPRVPLKYGKNIAIRLGNRLKQVVLPHNKVCRGLSSFQGVSVSHGPCLHFSAAPEVHGDRRCGGARPAPEFCLSPLPQNALIPWTTYTASHREQLVPKPHWAASLGMPAGSLATGKGQLTLGTAKLLGDRAGL